MPRANGTLRIVQWNHFAPSYDQRFDAEYTERWGAEHDVKVVVDHLPFSELTARAGGEVAAQRGHDIFGFVSPPPIFEEEVIDHREIVEEVEAKLGPMTSFVQRSVLNPRTGKYFGFADFWTPNPVNYRVDSPDRHAGGAPRRRLPGGGPGRDDACGRAGRRGPPAAVRCLPSPFDSRFVAEV